MFRSDITKQVTRNKYEHVCRPMFYWTSVSAVILLPPYVRTSKNYVICLCFHCHGTSSYHPTNRAYMFKSVVEYLNMNLLQIYYRVCY